MKHCIRMSGFTLVEILIAMAICVVGVVSIMVLFPIGANASRDAAMAGNAKDAADQILHYFKYVVENGDESAFDAVTGFKISEDPNGTDSETGNPVYGTDNDPYGVTGRPTDGDAPYDETKYGDVANQTGVDADMVKLFTHSEGTEIKQISGVDSNGNRTKVFMISYSSPDGGAAEIEDFSCIVAVWVTKVEIENSAGKVVIPRAAAFNVEVSWPKELDYSRRQKAYYCIETFKQ